MKTKMEKIDKKLFNNISILYVEDDSMTSDEVSFFFRKYINKFYVAKNGKEGLELFKEHKPDMVITDVQMPIMNGLTMSEEILKISPSTPIALTTAFSEGNYILKAIELGIDKYILKPINIKEMFAVIQKSLNLKTKKHLEYYDEYVEFILNSNPTFMFIMHSEKIEHANDYFLDLLACNDINSFQSQIKSCEDLFEIEELEDENVNWIEYIKNSSKEQHVISFKNPSFKDYFNKQFIVNYKHFETINKSVFIFNNINEIKLNKINSLAKEILKKNTLDNESLLYLEQIISTSNKKLKINE